MSPVMIRRPLKPVVTSPPMARATRRTAMPPRAQSMTIARVPRTAHSDRTVLNSPRPAPSAPILADRHLVARRTTRATSIRIRRRRPRRRSRVNRPIIPRPIIMLRATTPKPIILNNTLGRILTPSQERPTIRRRFPPSIPARSIVPLHNITRRTIRLHISRRTRQTMRSILSDQQSPFLRGMPNIQRPHRVPIMHMELAHPMNRLRILPTPILQPPR